MIPFISIRFIFFISDVNSLKKAAQQIDDSSLGIDTNQAESPALTRYIDSFDMLRALMHMYKQMIIEDTENMNEIANLFEVADIHIAGLLRGR